MQEDALQNQGRVHNIVNEPIPTQVDNDSSQNFIKFDTTNNPADQDKGAETTIEEPSQQDFNLLSKPEG